MTRNPNESFPGAFCNDKKMKKASTILTHPSSPSNLVLGRRADPAHSKIHGNGNDTDDPNTLGIVGVTVAENDGANDTTEIASRTDESGNNAVGEGVHVGNKGEVSAVAGVHKDCGDGSALRLFRN